MSFGLKKISKLQYHLFAASCAFIWGTTFLVSKMLLETYSPIQIMMMRFFLAYLALWVCCPHWKMNFRDEVGFFAMSLFGNTLYYLCENSALLYTYSANVSILVSAAPITTAILILIVNRFEDHKKNKRKVNGVSRNVEKTASSARSDLSKKQISGIAIAFLGMALVVLNGRLVLHLSPVGDLLSIGAAVCWAFYSIILEKYTDRYSSFMISRKLMFYGMIQSIPLLLWQMFRDGTSFPIGQILQANYLLGILFLGLIGSAFCYIAWNTACAGMGVISANMYIYTIPFVTLIAGSIVYQEPITLMAVSGAVLISFGMMVSSGIFSFF